MDIEKTLVEKVKRFEDIRKNLDELQKQIGGLQEQQRAVYNAGLELKGQIDMLIELKQKEAEALAKSNTAKLILPEGVKPVVPEETPAPVEAAAPVLEVK